MFALDSNDNFNVFFRRHPKVVLQAEAAECGLSCIAMVASYYGFEESLSELRRRFPVSLSGSTLARLMAIGDSIGLSSRAVRCELEELARLELPCVLHWDLDHYVVLSKVYPSRVVILDPAHGMRSLTRGELSKHFTGVALELLPTPKFRKHKPVQRVRLSDLWSRIHGLSSIICQLLFLTFLLQIFGLLMPVANQMVIDDVLGHGDRDLLITVIVGFGLFAIAQTCLEGLRSIVQLYAGQKLALQLSGNLLRHLLRLPATFFERRHIGDIMSRFNSLGPVQEFLTGGIVGVVLDAIMLIPCGIIMFIYSPLLSIVILADIGLSSILQFLSFHKNRGYTAENIALSAKAQSIFLETVRGARSIKLSGGELERRNAWYNAMSDQQNVSFRQSCFNLLGHSGFSLVTSAQYLLLLYFGAMEILNNHLSLGMFIAFQSYAAQFSQRSKSLMAQAYAFQMLGLHLERLADIVMAEEEEGLDYVGRGEQVLSGALEIRDAAFRYSPEDPWVFRDVSIKVDPGERVAIVGPSGGGKSTLLKILTGLYVPVEGEVLVDGLSLRAVGMRTYRSQIGVVMQDDQLLSGTLIDNIAFFQSTIDIGRVEEVSRLACVHDEIMNLPMGYHSLIGDMGSVLSGGQRQRILLARALYRAPRVLFLDEGTANLDIALEAQILHNLKALGITQVVVAHRQEAIAYADRVYCLAQKGATELMPQIAAGHG